CSRTRPATSPRCSCRWRAGGDAAHRHCAPTSHRRLASKIAFLQPPVGAMSGSQSSSPATDRRDRAPMTPSVRRALRLEHRLTQPNASLADLEAAVALATSHELSGLTVSPWLVKSAKRKLGRSRVTLGTVIGFPHGAQVLSVKAFEASKALEQGATQIDFVLNGGALASGDDETVLKDMLAVLDMAPFDLAAAGVIGEADPMSEDLVRKACHLAERAGADYVVTSGGA